jgi:hypothetical protein
MFQAQMLHANGTTSETSVLSPWFPRGGDNILFAADLVAQSTTDAKIDVELLTKNSEDTGEGALVAGSKLSLATRGVDFKTVDASLEELVRFRFTIDVAAAATDWVIFRVLQPSWYDAVEA